MTTRTIGITLEAGPGVPAPGPAYVKFWPSARFTDGTAINLPFPVSTILDESGMGSVTLRDTPTDQSWVWMSQEVVAGGAFVSPVHSWIVDADSSRYESLTPSDPVPGSPAWGPTAEAAFAARDEAQAAAREAQVIVSPQADWSGTVSPTLAEVQGQYLLRTLTGNVDLVLPDGPDGVACSLTVEAAQDTTGSRTLTVDNVRSAYGVAIVLSADANAVDILRFEWNGSEWTAYLGAGNLSIPTSWVVA